MFPGSEDDGSAVSREQGFLPERDAVEYIERVRADKVTWELVDTRNPRIAVLTDVDGWMVHVHFRKYGHRAEDFSHYEEIEAPDGASWCFDDGGALCDKSELPQSIQSALYARSSWCGFRRILDEVSPADVAEVSPQDAMRGSAKFRLRTGMRSSSVPFAQLAVQAHNTAKSKGWWDEPRMPFPTFATLVHSEVSEAVEAVRKGEALDEVYLKEGKPEGVPTELADIVIRVMDYCEAHEIDLEAAIRLKMAYNQTRPHRHGGKAF